MLKHMCIFLLVCSTLISLTSCTANKNESLPSQSTIKSSIVSEDKNMEACRLIVENKDITSDYVKMNKEQSYVELPLVAILKALGANVKWESATIANISRNGNHYVLNTTEHSLIIGSSDFNLLFPAPGISHEPYFKDVGKELIVENASLQTLFQFEIHAYIKIDYENNIVKIGC